MNVETRPADPKSGEDHHHASCKVQRKVSFVTMLAPLPPSVRSVSSYIPQMLRLPGD